MLYAGRLRCKHLIYIVSILENVSELVS